jgi:hypothetical protein
VGSPVAERSITQGLEVHLIDLEENPITSSMRAIASRFIAYQLLDSPDIVLMYFHLSWAGRWNQFSYSVKKL